MSKGTKENFQLKWRKRIEEHKTDFVLYEHIQTGSQVLIAENQDTNKMFAVNFTTPVEDSTGIAHILEHSVLNGSEKYPLKEPFVYLLKQSLNTFLNALTFPDKTLYPIASENEADFYNLAEVYIDAVFHPLLDRQTLMQEGWHYKFNEEEKLEFNGVVFNEMKAAFLDVSQYIQEHVEITLFRDTDMQHMSGGNPPDIPNLTYENFVKFHETYYHPTNAKFFFYGNGNTNKHLDFVHERIKKYDKKPPKFPANFKDQTPNIQDEHKEFKYPVSQEESDLESKYYYICSWLIPRYETNTEHVALGVLSYALWGADSGILRKNLIESGLGEDVYGDGLESYRQDYFWVGLKNTTKESKEKIQTIIDQTLQRCTESLDEDAISAALNVLEYGIREGGSGRYPKSLNLFFKILEEWNYGRDPLNKITFAEELEFLRGNVNKGYFQKLIKKYFVANKNRIKFTFEPDKEFVKLRTDAERKKLDDLLDSLTEKETTKIKEEQAALEVRQNTPDKEEDIKKLPVLHVSDLNKQNKVYKNQIIEENNVSYVVSKTNSREIIYMNIGFNLKNIPVHLVDYLGLLENILFRIGTKDMSYEKLTQQLDLHSGGVGANIELVSHVEDYKNVQGYFFIGTKTFKKDINPLLNLIYKALTDMTVDKKRFKDLLLEAVSDIEESIVGQGHRVALSKALSKIRSNSYFSVKIGGLDYLDFLRSLKKTIDTDFDKIYDQIKELVSYLFVKENIVVSISTDVDSQEIKKSIDKFINQLPKPKQVDEKIDYNRFIDPCLENEYLTIPSQVNFVSQAFDADKFDLSNKGLISVTTVLARMNYLWNEIRVKGGAYGAVPVLNADTKVICFATYRDPHLDNSLNVFKNFGKYFAETKFSKYEVDGAIISAIGEFDDYLEPAEIGYLNLRRYLKGSTEEERQKIRDQVLQTKPKELNTFGETLCSIIENGAGNNIVIVGGEENKDKLKTAKVKFKKLL